MGLRVDFINGFVEATKTSFHYTKDVHLRKGLSSIRSISEGLLKAGSMLRTTRSDVMGCGSVRNECRAQLLLLHSSQLQQKKLLHNAQITQCTNNLKDS